MGENNDPQLNIESLEGHPVYSRAQHDVTIALKNIGAVGKTLQVYAEPGAQMYRIIHSVTPYTNPS